MGYRIEGRTQTVEVRGGTRVVKVREFHCYATPSETYFQFRRSEGQPCYASPGPCASQFAARIEAVLALANVVDVVYSQNTTAGGLLQDWMTTYYQTADGAISGSVESTLAQFGPTFTRNQVSAEIASGGDFPQEG